MTAESKDKEYYYKICQKFEEMGLVDKQSLELAFHLEELAVFSPKYRKLIDTALSAKTKNAFKEALDDLWGVLNERHEIEYHLVPAERLLIDIVKRM